jgi:hypothetical protein
LWTTKVEVADANAPGGAANWKRGLRGDSPRQNTTIIPWLERQRLTRRCRLPYASSVITIEGRTTVAIVRRLSTIESANVIYVIGKGQVIEQGRHDELVVHDGLYSLLYGRLFLVSALCIRWIALDLPVGLSYRPSVHL